MYFTDSHIHLQDYKSNNATQIIVLMQSMGFAKAVCVSSNIKDWTQVKSFALSFPEFVVPAFGIHPWNIEDIPQNWAQELEEFLISCKGAWVGECGLDNLKQKNKERQFQVFQTHMELAKKHKRPMNIHLLKAEADFARLLPQMPQNFVLHSYSGSIPFIKKIISAGGYISLSPASLKGKNFAALILNTGIKRLLFESDAPYQSDFEQIKDLAQAVAAIKNASAPDVIYQIYNNLKELNHDR